MTLLLQILSAILLALGSGVIFLAVLKTDKDRREEDQMSDDWLRGQR